MSGWNCSSDAHLHPPGACKDLQRHTRGMTFYCHAWYVQVEVHPYYRNEHVRDWAKKNNVHVTAYSPLSSPGLVKEMGMEFPTLQQVRTLSSDDPQSPFITGTALLDKPWPCQHDTLLMHSHQLICKS